jgi:hypothetical protein
MLPLCPQQQQERQVQQVRQVRRMTLQKYDIELNTIEFLDIL